MSEQSANTNTPISPVGDDLESILNDPLRVSDGALPSITGVEGQATQEQLNGELDAAGSSFDPAIHDPARRKNAKGLWASKRGRKAGGVASPSQGPRIGGQGSAPGTGMATAAPVAPKYQAEAATAVGMFTAGHATLLGAHWLPDAKSGEFAAMVETTRAAMEASGQDIQLPWWMPVAGMYAVYAIPRFQHETTRTRVAGLVGKVRSIWAKLFKRPKKTMGTTKGETASTGQDAVDRTSATVTSSAPVAQDKPFWANSQPGT